MSPQVKIPGLSMTHLSSMDLWEPLMPPARGSELIVAQPLQRAAAFCGSSGKGTPMFWSLQVGQTLPGSLHTSSSPSFFTNLQHRDNDSILQKGKLRLKELTQGHVVCKWQILDLKPAVPNSGVHTFQCCLFCGLGSSSLLGASPSTHPSVYASEIHQQARSLPSSYQLRLRESEPVKCSRIGSAETD